MMKRNLLAVVLITLVFSLSLTFLTGCAKKAGLKEQAAMTQVQKPAAGAGSPAMGAPAQDDAAAREQALREQALREKAAKEAADKATKEAAERAKKPRQKRRRFSKSSRSRISTLITTSTTSNRWRRRP
jgi:hypothetical protein